MHAVILSIGDELVLGQTVDTNSAFLSAELARQGIGTLYHHTVADDRAWIARAIAQAAQDADLVIITGGLGPTDDDLTREALADALGQPLVEDAASVERIAAMFRSRGRDMPDRNRVQAQHPQGTGIIANDCGTAPGIRARLGRATLYVTPGVPMEMKAMWQKSILPDIETIAPQRETILTATVHTFGLGESTVAERLGTLMDRRRNPKVGTTVANGVVSVRLRSEFADGGEAQRQLDDTRRLVRERLGAFVYGEENQSLQEAVLDLLRQRQLRLATAESCTGGLLGRMLTDVPGSSAAYQGGWVTYANAMKQRELGVSGEDLTRHGAVSGPVVRQMARAAAIQAEAHLALAVTGVAGPDGGSPEKPVGTVWVGLAHREGLEQAPRVEAMLLSLGIAANREMIRDRAAKFALQMLRFHLLGESLDQMTWGRRVAETETATLPRT